MLNQIKLFLSYFLSLMKESKQRKSSQKNPASRTRLALPGFLAGPRTSINKVYRMIGIIFVSPYTFI
jgi:hypothetical protein